MQSNTYRFHRGDIADLIAPTNDNPAIIKQYDCLKTALPCKLIILRPIDDRTYLTAICRSPLSGHTIDISQISVKVKRFYPVDFELLSPCNNLAFSNKSLAVNEIYTRHNIYSVQKKQRIESYRKQKAQRRKEEKATENKYRLAYLAAIMNNDKQKAAEIIKIIGHEPGERNIRSSAYGSVSYSNASLRPFVGGKFSPK